MAASLAHAAELLSDARSAAPDRRRYRRAPVTLSGRLWARGSQEYDCRTTDVSAGGARIVAAQRPKAGEDVVIYLDTIGRAPAQIIRTDDEDSFGVVFHIGPHKREKIAEQLTWLLNKDRLGLIEERRGPRFGAAPAGLAVTLEDGKTLHCEVLDFSLVGASLRTAQKRPEIGAWVRLGQTYGRVSRYVETGFAIDFQATYPPR